MPPRGTLKSIQNRISNLLEEITSIECHLSPSSPVVFDAGWENLTELRLAWALAKDIRAKVETLNTTLFYFLRDEENGKDSDDELYAKRSAASMARARSSGNCTFTEYLKEGERPAAVLGDALAAIDAGVDELV